MATELLISFVVSILICHLILKWIREWNYPPGPKGLPLIGYGVFLGNRPNHTLRDLGKEYGDIFSFYIGPRLHIIINEYQLAKELLNHPLMLSRPPKAFDFAMGKAGFGGMNGVEWQEQRRFSVSTMRNLGLGKGLWETMTQESAQNFVNDLKATKGKPVDFETILSFNQVSNNIALLFGRHLDKEKDAADIELLHQASKEITDSFSSVGLTVAWPSLAKFINSIEQFFKPNDQQKKFEDIFRKEVANRMKNPESLTKEDFIGCFFQEMEARKKEGKAHTFQLETLLGDLLVLFLGGNDSSMASISWLLLLMANHQDIQKKIQDEIDDILERDSIIYYDDRTKFPFTMATILEMTRWVSITALFPPRYCPETFTFKGYTIPEGSSVICNIWSIMRDPRYFKDPEVFRPERFLSEDGDKVVKMDGYGAFSFGRRNCPGEGVAIMTIFLYFVTIMQKIKISAPPGCAVDLNPSYGGALFTRPQNLCFTER